MRNINIWLQEMYTYQNIFSIIYKNYVLNIFHKYIFHIAKNDKDIKI